MVIETDSCEKAKEARRKRASAILRNHKGNCATCPQYEFCGLLAARSVGIEQPVFTLEEEPDEELIDQKLKINLNRCVRCGKCVRVCSEIRKVGPSGILFLSPRIARGG